MNTEYFESLARLTPALHDTIVTSTLAAASERCEPRRSVRCDGCSALARTGTTHTSGAPGPIGSTARARRSDGTEVLRQMGEDIPSWFD